MVNEFADLHNWIQNMPTYNGMAFLFLEWDSD